MHLAVEQAQKMLSVVITAGQRGDSPQFQAVLGRIRVRWLGPGRPRTKPDKIRAGKTYGSRANRSYLRRRKVQCTIPREARPDHQSQETWLPRWTSAEVRRGRLPRASRGRVRHQSRQEAPRGRHAVRHPRSPPHHTLRTEAMRRTGYLTHQ
ncbi:transposase [Streptomyces sp900116325]|uniref:Transposase n=1 Tax=Streptomyces sp. 900116325 TaxID=3154295 RepID=A0ABV2UJV2_9ACTN